MSHRIIVYSLLLYFSFDYGAYAQESYVATVMEYGLSRDPSITDLDHVLQTTRDYVQHIQRAKTNLGSHIIVFPEYGLTTHNLPSNLENISTLVPSPSDAVIPCITLELFARHLVDLSCAALEHDIHVVVNLIERANSSTNATIYYNTNVLLDNRGVVRARYRKINLMNENMFTAGDEVVVFATNFGVTFGLLTSTDLLYRNPTMQLMNDLRVTDLIYPNFWHSETPFLKGLSIQDGFSKAYGVNLLASGYSNPSGGTGGAGIFLANATVGAIDLSTTVVQSRSTARVAVMVRRTPGSVCEENIQITPRIIGQLPNIDTFGARFENMEHYTFADLDMGVNDTSGEICSEGSQFCCEYHITFNTPLTNRSTVYKMAAFYGVRGLANSSATIGVRNCGLVACQNDNSTSCGARPPLLNVDFARITIRTNVPVNEDSSYLPATLNSALHPMAAYMFCQGDIEDRQVRITMSIERMSNALTFGIFGRAYDLDGMEVGRGLAANVRAATSVILSFVVAVLFM